MPAGQCLALVAAGALLVLGCGASNPPPRDASGAITGAGGIAVNEARVGDCYDEADEPDSTLETLAAVPCAEPHDREVFHRVELPGDRYPGPDLVSEEAAQACLDAFAGYVGIAYADSTLDAYPIVPSRDSWDEHDDRTVVCVLGPKEGALTGSQHGAAR